jgi:sporulation integral membrane protein YlbJ
MHGLFRIPGVGGWALAMGATAGLPSGARATASLRKQGLLTRGESQRLLAVSHLGSPVFVITIVGVGFLGNARLGLLLSAVHFAAALAVGVTLRLRPDREVRSEIAAPPPASKTVPDAQAPLIRRSFAAMQEAHAKDGRAFGKMLGDSVTASVQSLMMIGGYMIIFSVLVQIIDITQISGVVQHALALVTSGGSEWNDAVRSSFSGLLEIHLGTYSFARLSGLTGLPLAAAVAAVLGWGGLSSHVQAVSLAGDAQLRYLPFLAARFLHAGYSYVLTIAVWPFASGWIRSSTVAFAAADGTRAEVAPFYPQLLATLSQLAVLLTAMLLLSLLLAAFRTVWRRTA